MRKRPAEEPMFIFWQSNHQPPATKWSDRIWESQLVVVFAHATTFMQRKVGYQSPSIFSYILAISPSVCQTCSLRKTANMSSLKWKGARFFLRHTFRTRTRPSSWRHGNKRELTPSLLCRFPPLNLTVWGSAATKIFGKVRHLLKPCLYL